MGSVVGDLVVRPASAFGRVKLLVDNQATIGGRRHFDILDDPSLVDRILGWIEPGRAGRGQPASREAQVPVPARFQVSSTVTASPAAIDSASRIDRLTGRT